MLFSSVFFIFLFLPLFLLLFFIIGQRYRDYFLLLASISFYAWGEPTFCMIALVSATIDYALGHCIFYFKKQAKYYLTLGIIANLSVLVYYKYINFFLSNLAPLFPKNSFHFELFTIALPIGVSFIVFEKITYLVDIYRGLGKPAATILNYLNYVFLFPKLLAGPIIKYHEIETQLHHRMLTSDDAAEGFKRFIRGLIKKVFFADTCGTIVNLVFALSPSELSCQSAWLGIVCFTLQIYFDFSGYSDMALGLSRMMGFRLKENFNMPYISGSFTEFWRRWHISLSTWIREYLYIPLGGNQVTPSRMMVNLWICFILSGLWHGANWTFILWGAYNGFFLMLDKFFWLNMTKSWPKMITVAITFLLIMLGWVIFRSQSFSQIIYYFSALFHFSIQSTVFIDITPDRMTAILLGLGFIFATILPGYKQINPLYLQWNWRLHFEGFFFGILGLLSIAKMVGVSYNPFLYFRF